MVELLTTAYKEEIERATAQNKSVSSKQPQMSLKVKAGDGFIVLNRREGLTGSCHFYFWYFCTVIFCF
jgi:hypothetical protein